jgi:hypothetical protein
MSWKWLFAVIVAAALVYGAVAQIQNETVISGSIPGCQQGILVPPSGTINLSRYSDNIQHLGIVSITGCNDAWDCNISADSPAMYLTTNASVKLPASFQLQYRELPSGNWSQWYPVQELPTLIGTGSKDYDFNLKQPVGGSDYGGDYQIAIQYTFLADPPETPS